MRRTKSEINIIDEAAPDVAVSETEPPKGAHENEKWGFYREPIYSYPEKRQGIQLRRAGGGGGLQSGFNP
jgi:hypothetical protein